MFRIRTPFLLFAAMMALVVFHVIAVRLFLYWTYWWLDIPMHVMGGAVATAFVAWWYLLYRRISAKEYSRAQLFLCSMVAALLIGVAWEVFEYSIGMTFADGMEYVLDTALDLGADISGGLAAYLVFLRTHFKLPASGLVGHDTMSV